MAFRRRFIYQSVAYRGRQDVLNDLTLNSNLLSLNHLLPHARNFKEGIMNLASSFNSSANEQFQMLSEDPNSVYDSLINLIEAMSHDHELISYVMATIDGSIIQIPKFLRVLRNIKPKGYPDIVALLKMHIHFGHKPATVDAAFHILALLYDGQATKDCLIFLNQILEGKLEIGDYAYLSSIVHLTKHQQLARHWSASGGLQRIKSIVQKSDDSEIVYLGLVNFWTLTFEQKSLELIANPKKGIVKLIVFCTGAHLTQKVARISMEIYDNIKKNQACLQEMVDCNLLSSVDKVLKKGLKDAELQKMYEELGTQLQSRIGTSLGFDKYMNQINKQHLLWGIVHTQKFIIQQIKRFQENDFHIVKILAEILKSGQGESPAVAAHDLGVFGKFHPYGNKVLESMGVKDKLMGAAKIHKSGEVRERAIQALEKIVSQRWQTI